MDNHRNGQEVGVKLTETENSEDDDNVESKSISFLCIMETVVLMYCFLGLFHWVYLIITLIEWSIIDGDGFQ